MGATTIFFNGRLISVPGSYSEVDASGLEQVGLGASGIVAVLGTGEGGKPVSEITETKDFIRLTKPGQAQKLFRSGDLREVGDMLFAPAKDPDILGGAQSVVAMKVNPATASSASLANAQGNAIDLTSKDFGAFTAQINVSLADGTNQGKLLTIKFEDITESVDDLGGDTVFTLEYTPGTAGYTTMTAQVQAGGSIRALGTKASLGLDSEFSGTQLATNHLIEALSSSAGDTTQSVVVYGLSSGGVAQTETIALNGTGAVAGLLTYSKILGLRVVGTLAGTVTVQIASGGAVLTTGLATTKGLVKGLTLFVNATTVSIVADGASTAAVLVEGKNASGAYQIEKLTLNGTTPVVSTLNFSSIQYLAYGLVAAARTATLTAEAAKALSTVQTTLQKAADYFNARFITGSGGFAFTLVTTKTAFLLSDLDVQPSAINVLSVAAVFKADLFAIIDWINSNSQYVTAAMSSGASGGAPLDTSTAVFLVGGAEGTALFSHWQKALNLLKQTRVNSIVVLTGDPAVHAALDAHCAYMGGIGRSERDAFVGLLNSGLDDVAPKAEIQSQIVALNTRHIRAYGQAIERFDSSGVRTEFPAYFLAAICAGAQAGAPVGTPLTHKYMNVLSFRQASDWNPTDDAEEMIQSGLSFLESVEGVGLRIVRNNTTFLQSSNLAFIEGSVNQAVNFATFNFRTAMEAAVGKKGFAGTINAAKGIATGTLGLLVDAGTLVAYRSLDIELALDVLEVAVEIAPVIPINFVKNTIHLVTIRQTAA